MKTVILIILTGIYISAFAYGEELSGELVDGVRVVKVQAFRYGFSPDPIVVKEGDYVRFEITTKDVKHGLGIKEYKINVPIPVGETKTVEFLANKVGEFKIKCTVFCGFGHGRMKAVLKVVE